MKILRLIVIIPVLLGLASGASSQQVKQNDKLHIIIIGAHPDDPDEVGGTAYLWAKAGHDVLMVSLTHGDAVIRHTVRKNLQRSGGKKQGKPVK